MKAITLTIPATSGGNSGVKTYYTHGRYFLVNTISGDLRVVTDLGNEYQLANAGDGFGDPQSRPFRILTFYNDGALAVTITFYATENIVRTPDVSIPQANVNVTSTLTNTLANCAEESPAQLLVTTTAAAIVSLSAVDLYVRQLIVQCRKTLATPGFGGAINTGLIAIGFAAPAGQQTKEFNPGDEYIFQADTGGKLNLKKFYLRVATDNDGVVLIYW